jgi:hypothetical protein
MTTHEYLKLNDFGITLEPNSPGYHEIDFLIEVASEIPKKMEDLDDMDPQILASRCLAAMLTTTAFHAEALAWCGWREVEAQTTLGRLMASSQIPVTIRKDAVKADEKYEISQNKYKTASAYVEFYVGMKKGFEAGHYWAREKEKAMNEGMKRSGYDSKDLNKPKIESYENEPSGNLTFD